MSDDLRWVAVELLGWDVAFEGAEWVRIAPHPHGAYDSLKRSLESWHGIGLVIEAMKKQPIKIRYEFGDILWRELHAPWWANLTPEKVFTAARRAVEGVTSDGGSNDGS
jgi:hypothetical protein